MKLFATVVVLLTLCACGGGAKDNAQRVSSDTLSERQRDSMLAGSRIPGARGVGKAMRVADSTSAGTEQTNAVARDTSNDR